MKDTLNILWTNADPITAELMVMMYATNAKKRELFKTVRVIIWGATAKLVAENEEIQSLLAEAQEAGVKLTACSACAAKLEVTEALNKLGIETKPWGLPLTELIKQEEYLLTV